MRFILFVIGLFLSGSAVLAETRHALVIGIDTYKNIIPLKKAINDADAVSSALELVGFRVTKAIDADRRSFNRAVAKLTSAIRPGDEVVFFFAGHGIEVRGRNYLLPSDVPAAEPGEEDFVVSESIPVDPLLDLFRTRGARVSVLILDACRNNPFPADGSRSVGARRGLARMDGPPKGAFILFSAGSGQLALDRLSNQDTNPNSVFTRALLPRLTQPDLTIHDLVQDVRQEVQSMANSVNHKQFPAYYDELEDTFRFNTKKRITLELDADPEVAYLTLVRNEDWDGLEDFAKRYPDHPKSKNARQVLSTISDRKFWKLTAESNTPEAYATYIAAFPSGLFVDEAKARMEAPHAVPAPATKQVIQFSVFKNVDVFGGDLTEGGIRGITQQQCQDLCAGNTACVAYSFVADQRQWCWPKSSLGERSYKPGLISGIKYSESVEVAKLGVMQPEPSRPAQAQPKAQSQAPPSSSYQISYEMDFPGRDLTGRDKKGITLAQCQRLCSNTPGCAAFSYVHHLEWCWPKQDVSGFKPNNGVISGFNPSLVDAAKAKAVTQPFERFPNTDFLGRDLTDSGHRGVSLEQCEAICVQDRNCAGYAYMHKAQWCWPKYGVGAVSQAEGITSGQKN